MNELPVEKRPDLTEELGEGNALSKLAPMHPVEKIEKTLMVS